MENNTRKEPDFSSLINHPAITELSLLLQRIKYDTEYIKVPEKGWIYTIRSVCNMPLKYLAEKITRVTKSGEKIKGISPEAIKQYEESEANKNISLASLEKVAEAMNMKLVYFFVPVKEGSLEEEVKHRITAFSQSDKVTRIKKPSEYLKDIPKEIWSFDPATAVYKEKKHIDFSSLVKKPDDSSPV